MEYNFEIDELSFFLVMRVPSLFMKVLFSMSFQNLLITQSVLIIQCNNGHLKKNERRNAFSAVFLIYQKIILL